MEYNPDKITINQNDPITSNITDEYDFEQENNVIILELHSGIKSCCDLFGYCSNISEIDLSNFNTQTVTNFRGMFSGCTSLTSINFENFDTSNAEHMDWMFNGSSSLQYLNVSNLILQRL